MRTLNPGKVFTSQKAKQLLTLAMTSALLVSSASALAAFSQQFSRNQVNTVADTPVDFVDFIPEILAQDYSNSHPSFSTVADTTDEALSEQLLNDPTYGYKVVALVDISQQGSTPTSQSITVFKLNGAHFQKVMNWKVSTGLAQPFFRSGRLISKRITRPGFYRAEYLDKNYVSQSYHEAMPYSVFYDRAFGTAIHATSPGAYSRLGTRASFGCTRLTFDQAKAFFELVTSTGYGPIIKLEPFPESGVATPEVNPVGVAEVVQGYRAMVINTNPADRSAAAQVKVTDVERNPDLLFQIIRGEM